jgi:hypothetical protein
MAAGVAVTGWRLVSRPRSDEATSTGAVAVALPSAVRFGDAAAEAAVLLFVDFESAASRQVFRQVTGAIAAGELEVPAELRLLYLPAAACAEASARAGCVGPRLVECAEALAAGSGVRAAGALFDLQWASVTPAGVDAGARREPPWGPATPAGVVTTDARREPSWGPATPAGVDATDARSEPSWGPATPAGVDADARSEPPWGPATPVAAVVARVGVDAAALAACAAGPSGVLAEHAALAARHGLVRAPGGLVVDLADPRRAAPFSAWLTRGSLALLLRCLMRGRCEGDG